MKLLTDESGMKYKVLSKLEHKLLNARKHDKNTVIVLSIKIWCIFKISW